MHLYQYVVVLHRHEDLEDFYNDMETEGGSITIPDRQVEVYMRKPTSRATFYLLTPTEAKQIKSDPRVKSVDLFLGDNVELTQRNFTGNFVRSGDGNATHNQWGLWRHFKGENQATFDSTNDVIQDNISYPFTGKNVDVIIVDGTDRQDDHMEFLNNSGQSRVVNYNWYQHAAAVGDSVNIGQVYNPPQNNTTYHATHVAGTVAGKNEGWATDANIYFLGIIGTNAISSSRAYDYIRAFHNSKPINPTTGRKNPTICNNSWGATSTKVERSDIVNVFFNGQTYTPGGTPEFANTGLYGVYSSSSLVANFTGDPENIKNRFTTSGSPSTTSDKILDWPETWEKIPNQTYSFTQDNPENTYEITVSTPCDVLQIVNITATTNSDESSITVRRILSTGASISTTVPGPNINVELGGGFGLGSQGEVTIRYEVEVNAADSDRIEFEVNWNISTGDRGDFFDSLEDDLPYVEYEDANTQVELNASASVTNLSFAPIASTELLTLSTKPPRLDHINSYGFWSLDLPFSINYLGQTYTSLFVNTNSSITFGSGWAASYGVTAQNPSLPKILLGAGPVLTTFTRRECRAIKYGTEGSAPNREFRIIWEGSSTRDNIYYDPENPQIRWEIRFFENNPNIFDITFEENQSKMLTGAGIFHTGQLNNFEFTGARRIYNAPRPDLVADVEDAIDDGIIVVASAGNDGQFIYSPNHPYYNNYMTLTTGEQLFYHRGNVPARVYSGNDNAVIVVGALDLNHKNSKEKRASFTNVGEAVDIFAAGNLIQSSVPDRYGAAPLSGSVNRGGGHYYRKISGTSMSGPQVTGILACMLEQYPDMNQKQARQLLKTISKPSQMFDTAFISDYPVTTPESRLSIKERLGDAANLVLAYPKPIIDNKPRFPKIHKGRPASGSVYPRRQIRRRKIL